MKPLRPFFPYYGSKYRLARRLPSPAHATIVEPFAGSACYSLHHHQRRVVLVDLDPVVAGIWRWLIREATELGIRSLPIVDALDDLPDAVPSPARALIGFWMGRCLARPATSKTAMGRAARGTSTWSAETRETIAKQLAAIRHWQIIEGDYREAPMSVATYFIDPPYEGRPGRRYRCSSTGFDFKALAAWVSGLPGQRIVTESTGASWPKEAGLVVDLVHSFSTRFGARRPMELLGVDRLEQLRLFEAAV